jgi:hypothetical protein
MKHVAWIALACLAIAVVAGCAKVRVRAQKSDVAESKTTEIRASFGPDAKSKNVMFEVTQGRECGDIANKSTVADEFGDAVTTFTAKAGVEDCRAQIQASVDGVAGSTSLFVNKLPITKVRIDGISVIALVLIASFAVDRIVRGAFFLLGFFKRWRRLVPDPADSHTTPTGARVYQFVYMCFAGLLALVALSFLGNVRVLEALGYTQVDPVIDTLFTGLLIMGGAERTEVILQKLGVGGAAGKPAATPLEITGKVVLENSKQVE